MFVETSCLRLFYCYGWFVVCVTKCKQSCLICFLFVWYVWNGVFLKTQCGFRVFTRFLLPFFVFVLIQIIEDSHVAIRLIFCLRTKLYTKWNYEVQVNQVTSTIMQIWFVIMNTCYLTKLYALFTLLRIPPLVLKSPLFSL